MRKTKVYDLDDTLVVTSPVYEAAIRKAAVVLSEHTGLSVDAVADVIDVVDTAARTRGTNPFSKDRFQAVFAAVATALYRVVGECAPPEVVKQVVKFAADVFDADYQMVPGAIDTLHQDFATGWQVLVYTKGDADVQKRKLQSTGLARYVDACRVVPFKTAESLSSFLDSRYADRNNTWVIGDNAEDEIALGIALGLKTALVANSFPPDITGRKPSKVVWRVSDV